MLPLPQDFMADPAQLSFTMVQGKVLIEATQHHLKMMLLFASPPVPMRKQPRAGASEKLRATLSAGDANEGKAPAPVHPTDMPEAKKLKGLRSQSVPAPHGGSKAPKEQQPSLVLGQLQIESRKAFPQLALKALRILRKLKASHKVISKTHQVRLATALWFETLLTPQVEPKVQLNATENRR